MTPTFEKEEINYKVTVGYATTQLPLHYEKENESAEVTVTGNTLQVGDNEVLVKVKAEDGTEKTYKIDAYRKNNEARLSSLTVPGCTISPEFNKDQLTYACEVGYNVSTMTLEGETEDAKATITSIPTNQTINFGSNELKVKVSAEDSNYTKEYKITVTKNKDTRNKLLYLGIEGFLILTPEGEYFSSNEFEYVANTEATRLKIVGEADSDVSTILGLDEFDIGWGTVEKVITVTSQSGLPSQYRITIHNNRPTAPVLQATATDWSGEDVIVSIYEDGSAETGIKEYEYYVTQSNQAPTDATVATGVLAYDSEEETTETLTISENGVWNVYYRLVSNYENKSPWSAKQVVKVDKIKPVAPTGEVTSGTKKNSSSEYYTSSSVGLTVTNGSDTLSGYKKNTYTLSGATTKAETEIGNGEAITVSNEGITTVTLYGYDNVDNKSEGRTYTIKIDRTPPVTGTATVTSGTKTVSTSDYYTSNNVVLTVADGSDALSGYWKTKYTLSGATVQSTKTDLNGTKTITITNEGETTVTLYGYDNAGNEGAARTYTIKIDRTVPPEGTITVTGTTGNNGWYKSNPTVKFTQSTDALSGTNRITYKLEGAKTANETTIGNNGTITIDKEGITTVTLYVYDNAGNRSAKTVNVKVDTVAPGKPTVEITGGTKGYDNWYKDNVTVKVTGSDGTSDVEKVTYVLTGSTTKSETDLTNGGTFTVSNNGTTTVTAYTIDKAGNKSEGATLVVKKDTTGPSKTEKQTVTRETNKLTVGYNAVSATSGIYEYKCYYGTSNNPSTLGTVSGNNCVFSGLTADTLYYFKRCAISNSNVEVCSDVSSERTRHNFYTITVVNGKFSDGTTTKSIEATESVTVTANSLSTNGWVEATTGTQEYREYYWDIGNSKTITVTKNETITFTQLYNVTKYKYKISFSGYSSLDRWTNDNGDKKFTFPAAQSKTGYTFQGWSTTNGATSGSAAGSTGTATGPTTYYAAFTANQYTVTLNKQSGTGGTDSVTATYDSAMPSATAPSRTGYTFGGYYTSTGGSGTQYYTSSMGSTRNWNLTSATPLYAKWTANQYTVTLNKQNGTGGTDSVTATYDSAMPTATAPSRTCYNFGGYYDATGGSGTQYYTSSMGSARTWNKTSATTLYAYWPLASYSISYTLNGGSVSSSNPTSYTCDSSAITLNNPSKTGYTFNGWTGTGLSSATTSVTIPAGSNGDRSYTANFTANQYTVTLNKQSGTGGTDSVTATYNSAMPSATKPTRIGYNFYGYYTSTSGSGTQYYTAGMQSARSYTLTSGTTLYAYWQTAPTISTGTTTSPSLVAGQWYYYKFVPSSSGTYDFQSTASADTYGYLYDASGNQLVANDDGGNNNNFLVSYNLTANTTYYYAIRWYSSSATGAIPLSLNKQVLTVTLNQQSGSGGTTSVTVENGQPMPSATMPLRMGYNFYGYYTSTSGSGTQYYTAGMQSARNYDKTTGTTLYAYWQTAPTISLGGTPSTPSLVGGQWYFYKFTPSSSGTYVFKSTVSSGDTYGYIYNSSGTQLTYNDDSGDGNNFSISYSFTGGTTYYLAARWYGSTTTGSIPLSLATSLKSNGTSCSTNSECASGYCSGTCQNQPVTYTVSVTNGKVNGSSSVTVNAGTQVTITANADSSSTSSSWSGQNVCSTPSNATNVRYKNQTYSEFSSWNDGNTSRSRTITVNSNLSYTANFNSGTRQVNKQTCTVTSGTVTTDYIYFDRITYCFNDGSYLYCRTFCDKSVSANVNYNCDYEYGSQPWLINKTFKFPEKTKEWVATYYRGTSSSGNYYPGKSVNISLYSSDFTAKRQVHIFLYRNGTKYAEVDSESSKSPYINYSVPQETIDTRVVGWVDQ